MSADWKSFHVTTSEKWALMTEDDERQEYWSSRTIGYSGWSVESVRSIHWFNNGWSDRSNPFFLVYEQESDLFEEGTA